MAADITTQPITPRPEFAGILKEDVRFSTGRQDTADRVNGWFDQLVLQSGLGVQPVVLILLSMLTALAVGGRSTLLFVAAMVAGMAIFEVAERIRAGIEAQRGGTRAAAGPSGE